MLKRRLVAISYLVDSHDAGGLYLGHTTVRCAEVDARLTQPRLGSQNDDRAFWIWAKLFGGRNSGGVSAIRQKHQYCVEAVTGCGLLFLYRALALLLCSHFDSL